jgi:hypothetical protein
MQKFAQLGKVALCQAVAARLFKRRVVGLDEFKGWVSKMTSAMPASRAFSSRRSVSGKLEPAMVSDLICCFEPRLQSDAVFQQTHGIGHAAALEIVALTHAARFFHQSSCSNSDQHGWTCSCTSWPSSWIRRAIGPIGSLLKGEASNAAYAAQAWFPHCSMRRQEMIK